ncbi:MAG: M20/M25/M40 family metallo-hydrolase, partial [Myxococcales bacterium]|nr:M20/M25/M40 family metallo-hydrolase [Myxococcales bacterium]
MSDDLRARLESRRDARVALLERLVRVNSYTESREGGRAVGELLAAELASIPGLATRVVASERFAPHLVASSAPAAGSAEGAVALVGHLDTVFPPGTFESFALEQEGHVAHGPGVLDMKGGLVVVLEALRAVAPLGVLLRLPVRLVVVSDEEVGSPEGRPLIERELAGASAALVFESGRPGDAVITRRKGTAVVSVKALGRAAHAGNAHADGVNAIWALARFVDRAQALTDYGRGLTVNVGTVRGGTSKNTVPEEASALVDLRFETADDGHALVARLHEVAAEATRGVPGSKLELGGGLSRLPLERSLASAALCAEYGVAAAAAGFAIREAA